MTRPNLEPYRRQRNLTALDYEMRGCRVKFHVQRALLDNGLKRLVLDTDPDSRKPQDQQIVLLETSEVVG